MLSLSGSQARAASPPWAVLVDPLLQVTVVFCLFSFKVFFIHFGEAGLRPDDLLILGSFLVLWLAGRIRRTPVSLPLKLYFAYIGVELASAVWNAGQGRVELVYSLIFVIRLLEYVAFYFIGYALARSHFHMSRVALWYAYMLCALVPLQMLGLMPIPGAFDRSRASGNSNGPYELAVICAFLLCFVAYRNRSVFIGAASVVIVILTASRITLVAVVLSLLHFAVTRTRSLGRVAAIVVTLGVIGGGLYSLSGLGIIHIGAFDRLENSSSLGIDDAREVYDIAPTVQNSTEYMEGSFTDLNGFDTQNFDGDMSGLIRFTRWLTLLKANLAHWDSILLGLGPSFGSAAVDGYFTRCYVETGVLGLGTFLAFLGSMVVARRGSNWNFRDYVLIMIISGLFIDTFLSYKSMMLLWLWHGMNQYRRKEPEGRRMRQEGTLLLPPMIEPMPAAGTIGAA